MDVSAEKLVPENHKTTVEQSLSFCWLKHILIFNSNPYVGGGSAYRKSGMPIVFFVFFTPVGLRFYLKNKKNIQVSIKES